MALDFAPGKTRIGWIGTGVMGSSMCGHLIAAGYQATVYNRTAEKTKALAAKGAAVAACDRASWPQTSDVVFTIVGYPARRPRGDPGRARVSVALPGRAR